MADTTREQKFERLLQITHDKHVKIGAALYKADNILKQASPSEMSKNEDILDALLNFRKVLLLVPPKDPPEKTAEIDEQLPMLKVQSVNHVGYNKVVDLILDEIKRKMENLGLMFQKDSEKIPINDILDRCKILKFMEQTIDNLHLDERRSMSNIHGRTKCWLYVKVSEAKDIPAMDLSGNK